MSESHFNPHFSCALEKGTNFQHVGGSNLGQDPFLYALYTGLCIYDVDGQPVVGFRQELERPSRHSCLLCRPLGRTGIPGTNK